MEIGENIWIMNGWLCRLREIGRKSDLYLLASGLAFSTTLSIFPLLAVNLFAFRYFGGLDKLLAEWAPNILKFLAVGSDPLIVNRIMAVVERIHTNSLGMIGFFSLLFTATLLVRGIEAAIQRVWGLKTSKRIFIRIVGYWCVIFFAPLGLAVFLAFAESGWLPYLQDVPHRHLIWFVATISVILIQKWVPNTNVKWSSATLGGLFIIVALAGSQKVYVWLIANMLTYNEFYGSLASVPTFLLWLLCAWYIFFIGTAITVLFNSSAMKAK